LEAEKEKSRLANCNIKEESRLRAQYMVQTNKEREVGKATKSNMRDYHDPTSALK
jgi:hypothetical protein